MRSLRLLLAYRPDWRAALPPCVLGFLPFMLFLPITLVRRVFAVLDVQAYFFPYHVMPARMLAEGHLPLWNPYAFSGIPLLGDGQTAMCYPPNWLFLVLPGPMALNYVILLQFSIAGIATYLFARTLGLWRLPAFIAGAAYMFSGFLTARVVHLSIMSGAALIPLVLLALDRLLNAQAPPATRRWLALSGLAVAMQFVAGHPQIPVYTALGAAALAVVRGLEHAMGQRVWRPFARAMLLLAGAYLLGAAVAAIQLLPWAEAARLSVRAVSANYDYVFGDSTGGAEWLMLLFPYLFGAQPQSLFAYGPWDIVAAVRAWEHSCYVGILPLALAGVAVGHLAELSWNHPSTERSADAPRLRHRWYSLIFLVLLLLIGILLAAGPHTPASYVVFRIPVLGSLRAVERGMALGSLALTLLAGVGVQRIVEQPQERARWLRVPAMLIVAAPVFFIWIAPHWRLPRLLGISPLDLKGLWQDVPATRVPLLLAVMSGLLLAWWSRRPAGRLTLGIAGALVLIDLGLYAISYNPTEDSSVYNARPAVARVLRGDGGLFRKATFGIDPNLSPPFMQDLLTMSWAMVYGIEDINGFNSLQTRRYTDYVFGRRASDVSYGAPPDASLLTADSAILSSLNVRYVLMPARAPIQPGASFRPIFEDAQVRIFENTQVYPRAYFVDRVRTGMGSRAVLNLVTTTGFDGRREALVEATDLPDLPPVAPSTTTARADAHRVSPTELRIATTTTMPRFLVVSEMYYPGWRAYVDGVETPIFCTNYLFRGVVVPEGTHVVSFVYRPASVLVGATVSALALISVGALLAVHRRRDSAASGGAKEQGTSSPARSAP